MDKIRVIVLFLCIFWIIICLSTLVSFLNHCGRFPETRGQFMNYMFGLQGCSAQESAMGV